MTKSDISVQIEAVLFFKGGALAVKELSEILKVGAAEIEDALIELKAGLEGRGVRLIREGNRVALGTAPETAEILERMRREELEGPLGKAGLETLAIIVFRGPLSRSDIEYVRGVNCTSILRSLMIRGLIERVENPNDKRSFHYMATVDLPAYLGVASLNEMPGYADVREGIEKVFSERELAEKESAETEHV